MGQALGGLRKKQPGTEQHKALRVASFRNYAAHMGTPIFTEGMMELQALVEKHWHDTGCGTAIMCSETLWWRCHRRMISDALTTKGWKVKHLGIKKIPDDHVLWDIARVDDRGKLIYDNVRDSEM